MTKQASCRLDNVAFGLTSIHRPLCTLGGIIGTGATGAGTGADGTLTGADVGGAGTGADGALTGTDLGAETGILVGLRTGAKTGARVGMEVGSLFFGSRIDHMKSKNFQKGENCILLFRNPYKQEIHCQVSNALQHHLLSRQFTSPNFSIGEVYEMCKIPLSRGLV